MKQETTTIQLTHKNLKANKLIAYVFICIGIIMLLIGANTNSDHNTVWGSLVALYGFGHLFVTRIRIWWNHK